MTGRGRRSRTARPEPARSASAVLVIGTGNIGMKHCSALARIPGVRPILLPRRPGRAEELGAAGFATAESAAAAARLGAGACWVASDTSSHARDALEALEAGMDVLVEKPFARDAREAGRVLRRARELGRKAFVGCVLRFSPSLRAFRARLGELGRLHSVRVECRSYLPEWRPARDYRESYSARKDEGGALRDLIHEIDYSGWLFGWPRSVRARLRNLGRLGIAAEESADLCWEAADEAGVSVHLDYLTRPARRGLLACGERGSMSWDAASGELLLELAGSPARRVELPQAAEERLLEQAKAFMSSLSAEPDPFLATAEDGVRALAVCDAARRSGESGREEEVLLP